MTPMDPREHDEWLAQSLRLDDSDGPALRLSAEEQRALVRSTLARVPQQPAARRSGARVYWLGAGVLVATAAAAATAIPIFLSGKSPEPASSAQAGAQSAALAPNATVARTTDPAVSAAASSEPAAVPELAPPLEPPGAPTSAGRKTLPRPVTRPSVLSSNPVAIDRLKQANALRSAQRYVSALKIYMSVARDYPNTLQADAARVAAADIKLEHLQDANGARALYDDAARAGGVLSEEASYGLAQAYRRQGNTLKERSALQAFLNQFPSSPFAKSARERLSELSQQP